MGAAGSTCLLWRRRILRRVVGDSMGSATRQISEKKPGAFTMKFLQRRSTTRPVTVHWQPQSPQGVHSRQVSQCAAYSQAQVSESAYASIEGQYL